MEKVTKPQLLKLISANVTYFWMVPSKCFPNPGHPFNTAIGFRKTPNDLPDMEDLINNFSYYNCNSELGSRVHFYVDESLSTDCPNCGGTGNLLSYTESMQSNPCGACEGYGTVRS